MDVGVDSLATTQCIEQTDSVKVITTKTWLVKEPLSGVRIGGVVSTIIGETMIVTSLTVKPSLVVDVLINVPTLVTRTGDVLTGVSSVGSDRLYHRDPHRMCSAFVLHDLEK